MNKLKLLVPHICVVILTILDIKLYLYNLNYSKNSSIIKDTLFEIEPASKNSSIIYYIFSILIFVVSFILLKNIQKRNTKILYIISIFITLIIGFIFTSMVQYN